MYKIGVKTHFDSAHLIRNHKGKCRNLHGHRWEIEVIFSRSELDEMGMVLDFKEIKLILKEITDKYDHHNLIEISPFDTINPTAENISREIFNEVKKRTPAYVNLEKVKVWESPETWVSFEK